MPIEKSSKNPQPADTVNLLELANEEVTLDTNHLPELRLYVGSPTVVAFPTATGLGAARHYIEGDEGTGYRGYVRCLGDGCVICIGGASPQEVLLIPVNDLLNECPANLVVNTKRHAGSLMNGLASVLKRAYEEHRAVRISKITNMRYDVMLDEIIDDHEWDKQIGPLKKRLEAGDIDLLATIPLESAATLVQLKKSIRNALKRVQPDHEALANLE